MPAAVDPGGAGFIQMTSPSPRIEVVSSITNSNRPKLPCGRDSSTEMNMPPIEADGSMAPATWGRKPARFISGIVNAPVETVLITDTLPLPSEKQADKITVLSVAPIIAQAISAVFEDTSVSEIFHGNHLA